MYFGENYTSSEFLQKIPKFKALLSIKLTNFPDPSRKEERLATLGLVASLHLSSSPLIGLKKGTTSLRSVVNKSYLKYMIST